MPVPPINDNGNGADLCHAEISPVEQQTHQASLSPPLVEIRPEFEGQGMTIVYPGKNLRSGKTRKTEVLQKVCSFVPLFRGSLVSEPACGGDRR